MTKNYWIVIQERSAVEEHPGWIFKTVESRETRTPPNYDQIEKGDQFVLASNPNVEGDSYCQQVFGVYEVERKKEYVENFPGNVGYKYPNAYIIEGRLLPGLREKWVTVPNLFLRSSGINQWQVRRAKSERDFDEVARQFKAFSLMPIDYRPLEGEPRNEQELVILFSSRLSRLGFERIITAQQAFPDATVSTKRGEKLHIEFKYWASDYNYPTNYRGNPVICLCWIDDREPSKEKQGPEVIELRSVLANGISNG